MLAFFCRVMRIYFRGQTFLQKGLLHLLGSAKNARGEILISKYAMLYAKKWHTGLYLVCQICQLSIVPPSIISKAVNEPYTIASVFSLFWISHNPYHYIY